MKKLSTFILSAMVAATGFSATNLSDARIYLNPGHGSWGPNDRPMATIPYPNLASGMPDTCGFFESNTNLWKALKVGSTLEKMGVKHENIMYSRVKNGPFPYVKGAADEEKYNRPLSEICEEVCANNFDMFLSIHSNAATEGTSTNYPLFEYRGKDGKGNEYVAGSYDMCEATWPLLYSNQIDVMSYYSPTNPNIRGDYNFNSTWDETGRTDPKTGETYYGKLGVLKHNAPGFLSEGYFHTYQPARHRALNKDYCGQEGVRYARGIAAYFNNAGEKTGYIMGTVKDLHEVMKNDLYKYTVGSDDQWVPINGAVVELYKGTTKVATYNVDNLYNGVFVFEGLEPGDYTLNCTANDYKPLADTYKTAVTVKANATSYSKLYLEATSYVPPTPDPVVYENYPDPVQDPYLTVASQYNVTAGSQLTVADLKDMKIRKSIVRGDSTFVLAYTTDNKPVIAIVDYTNQKVIKQLNVTGAQGVQYPISDIAFTADSILVACNMEETQFADANVPAGATRGVLRVYKWNNLDEAPVEWFTSNKSGNFNNANTGKTLAYTGTSKKGSAIVSAVTTGSSKNIRFLIFNIIDGQLSTDLRNQDAKYNAVTYGDDFTLTTSPRDPGNLIIDGSSSLPTEFKLNSTDVAAPTLVGDWSNADLDKTEINATYFKYAKHSLMVVPSKTGTKAIKLFDITDGLNSAKTIVVNSVNTDKVSNSSTKDAATTATYSTIGSRVNNADLSLTYVQDNNATIYTTKGTEQPVVKGVFAYGLTVTSSESAYTFKFSANTDANEGAVILYDQTTGKEVGRKAIANVKAGENSIIVNKSELPIANKLDWSIQLIGNSIPTISRITDLSDNNHFARIAGVAIDKSTESDYFGRVYVSSNKAGDAGGRTVTKGLYVYNADLTPQSTTAYGESSLNSNYRMGVDQKGSIYISDWSDPNSGVWIADPANLSTPFKNLFRNCTRDADGMFTNTEGVAVGGSTTSAVPFGSGDDMMLFTACEDYKVDGTGNNITAYQLGSTKDSWEEAPTIVYNVGKLEANGNMEILPDNNGVWVAQTRNSGNNKPSVPSLIYVNDNSDVLFNSGDALAADLDGTLGSGFAISNDGKTMVICNGSNAFAFYDLTWTNGIPSLKYKYSFTHDSSYSGSIYQMAFDPAGNLLTAGTYFASYAMPTTDNESTIAAKKAYAIDGRKLTIAAPTGLKASANDATTFKLEWTAPASTDFTGYNLYLNGTKVGTAAATDVSYLYTKPAPGTYLLGITATYPGDVESELATIEYEVSSVESVENNVTVTVSPNPTTGLVNISSPEEIVSVKLFNSNGALVLDEANSQINVSMLPSGIYFIKVNNLEPVRLIKK